MQAHTPAATKRVLIVDDEADIRDLFTEIFKSAGWTTDTAASADEAMVLYSLNSYDLLTLDWAMPGMDGSDLHHAISTMFGYGKRVSTMLPPRLPPILVVTGYFDQEEVQQLVFGERIVGILRKPVQCDKLLQVAEELVEYETVRKQRRSVAIARLNDRVLKMAHS